MSKKLLRVLLIFFALQVVLIIAGYLFWEEYTSYTFSPTTFVINTNVKRALDWLVTIAAALGIFLGAWLKGIQYQKDKDGKEK